WGLDPDHRAGFGVPATVIGNTWQGALDRLLIGTAVADADEHLAVGEIAPFGVDTGDVEILGALAFIVGRLAALTEHSIGPDRTVDDWAEILRQTCSDLFAVPDQASWQFDALERVLREIVDGAAASQRGSTVGLDL